MFNAEDSGVKYRSCICVVVERDFECRVEVKICGGDLMGGSDDVRDSGSGLVPTSKETGLMPVLLISAVNLFWYIQARRRLRSWLSKESSGDVFMREEPEMVARGFLKKAMKAQKHTKARKRAVVTAMKTPGHGILVPSV